MSILVGNNFQLPSLRIHPVLFIKSKTMKKYLLFIFCMIAMVHIGNAQTVVSILPATGISGDRVVLQINTVNTHFTTWTVQSLGFHLYQGDFSMIFTNIEEVVNDTAIKLRFHLCHDHPLGNYDFTLWCPTGVSVNNNLFQVLADPTPPNIIQLTTDSVSTGTAFSTYIITENTDFAYYPNNYSYLVLQGDTIKAFSVQYWQPWNTLVRFVLPFGTPTEFYDVYLYNSLDGTMKLENGLQVTENPNMPSLISCDPDTVVQGGTIELYLTGNHTNFSFFTSWQDIQVSLRKSDDSTVVSGEYNYTTTYGLSPAIVRATMALNYLLPPGKYDVITHDPLCGTMVLPEGLTILEGPAPPSVAGLSPNMLFAKDSLFNLNLGQFILVSGINTYFNSCAYIYITNGAYYSRLPYWHYYSNTSFDFFLYDIYKMPPGWYDFHFGNWNENLVLTNAFHIDNPTVGIQEVEKSNMNIYPNPCTGKATLKLDKKAGAATDVLIINVSGQVIKRIKPDLLENEIPLDLTGQPKGVYFVNTATKKGVVVKKLVVR